MEGEEEAKDEAAEEMADAEDEEEEAAEVEGAMTEVGEVSKRTEMREEVEVEVEVEVRLVEAEAGVVFLKGIPTKKTPKTSKNRPSIPLLLPKQKAVEEENTATDVVPQLFPKANKKETLLEEVEAVVDKAVKMQLVWDSSRTVVAIGKKGRTK